MGAPRPPPLKRQAPRPHARRGGAERGTARRVLPRPLLAAARSAEAAGTRVGCPGGGPHGRAAQCGVARPGCPCPSAPAGVSRECPARGVRRRGIRAGAHIRRGSSVRETATGRARSPQLCAAPPAPDPADLAPQLIFVPQSPTRSQCPRSPRVTFWQPGLPSVTTLSLLFPLAPQAPTQAPPGLPPLSDTACREKRLHRRFSSLRLILLPQNKTPMKNNWGGHKEPGQHLSPRACPLPPGSPGPTLPTPG